VRFGPFFVSTVRMDHPIEAYAIRVESDGKALVYSGDTAFNENLVALATDADLLLAEAAFRDGLPNPPHIHMTGSEAALTAKRAGVGRLVLTHIPPWHEKRLAMQEADGGFDGPIDIAAVGATYRL
jgi:ribonuclease BN (tRNA processing enzyme)